jgi:hypothetical protein
MPPIVSVLVPTDLASGSQLDRALASLQAQTCGDWENLLVGPHPTPRAAAIDRRIRPIPGRAPRPVLLNQAIDHATGRYFLILDPEDAIEPRALSSLIAAADPSRTAGAIGDYRFSSPVGELPGDPLADTPATLGWESFIRINPAPMHAILTSRAALASLRFRTDIEYGWDYDLWLRLAESGATWARARTRTATFTLRPLASDLATLTSLAAQLRMVSESLARCAQSHRTAELTRAYVDALLLLRAHRYAVDQRGPMHLAAAVHFPALFAQWWQRLGFHGNPPLHVLVANGGATEGIAAAPDLIARRLVDSCTRGQIPILLGLGRNARRVARHLRERGIPIRGRDNSLTSPPQWSIDDGIPIDLIPADSLFDPQAPYIMTVLNDSAFLARLPAGLTIYRWSAMPDLILSEWRESILGQATSTLIEPRPLRREAVSA